MGPADFFDIIAAKTFSLLAEYGLREHHKVLDIGCGCLRVGRLLIVYLNKCNYVGVEPNGELVNIGIKCEAGYDIIEMKAPKFIKNSTMKGNYEKFDFIFAQSIFTHCDSILIDGWFADIKECLKNKGTCLFTYFNGPEDKRLKEINGWSGSKVYHKLSEIEKIADKYDFEIKEITWPHPANQQWVEMVHKC